MAVNERRVCLKLFADSAMVDAVHVGNIDRATEQHDSCLEPLRGEVKLVSQGADVQFAPVDSMSVMTVAEGMEGRCWKSWLMLGGGCKCGNIDGWNRAEEGSRGGGCGRPE